MNPICLHTFFSQIAQKQDDVIVQLAKITSSCSFILIYPGFHLSF